MRRIAIFLTVVISMIALTLSQAPANADVVVKQRSLGPAAPDNLVMGCGERLYGFSQFGDPGFRFYHLAEYDTQTLTQTMAIKLDMIAPSDLVSSLDQRFLYFTGSYGYGRYNCATKTIDIYRDTYAGRSEYSAAAVDGAGDVYFTTRPTDDHPGSAAVIRFNSDLQRKDSVVLDADARDNDDRVVSEAIVVHPDGKSLFAITSHANGNLVDDVSQLYPVTLGDQMTVGDPLPMPFNGYSRLAITPDGKQIYATNEAPLVQSDLEEIDVSKWIRTRAFHGNSLGHLQVDPHGEYLYVQERNPASIIKFQLHQPLPKWKVAERIPLADAWPHTMAMSHNGSVIYSNTETGMATISVTPQVGSITPDTGAITGGEKVVVRGRYFSDDAVVRIGGQVCSRYNRQNVAGGIVCAAPPNNETGKVNVRVTNPGDQNDVLKDAYHYTKYQNVNGDCLTRRDVHGRIIVDPTCRLTNQGSPIWSSVSVIGSSRTALRGDARSKVRLVCLTHNNKRGKSIHSPKGTRCHKKQTLTLRPPIKKLHNLTLKIHWYATSIKGLPPYKRTIKVHL